MVLTDGLGLGSLGLLLDGSGGQKSSWNRESHENIVDVMGRENQSGAGLVLVLGDAWDDDGVANNCSETVDLSTSLYLADVSGAEND